MAMIHFGYIFLRGYVYSDGGLQAQNLTIKPLPNHHSHSLRVAIASGLFVYLDAKDLRQRDVSRCLQDSAPSTLCVNSRRQIKRSGVKVSDRL